MEALDTCTSSGIVALSVSKPYHKPFCLTPVSLGEIELALEVGVGRGAGASASISLVAKVPLCGDRRSRSSDQGRSFILRDWALQCQTSFYLQPALLVQTLWSFRVAGYNID